MKKGKKTEVNKAAILAGIKGLIGDYESSENLSLDETLGFFHNLIELVRELMANISKGVK